MHRIACYPPAFIPEYNVQAIKSMQTTTYNLRHKNTPYRHNETPFLLNRQVGHTQTKTLYLPSIKATAQLEFHLQTLQQQYYQIHAYMDCMHSICQLINSLPTFTTSLEECIVPKAPQGFDILHRNGEAKTLESVFCLPLNTTLNHLPALIQFGQSMKQPQTHFLHKLPFLQQHTDFLHQQWLNSHQQLLFYGGQPNDIALPKAMMYSFSDLQAYHTSQGGGEASLVGYPKDMVQQLQDLPSGYYFLQKPAINPQNISENLSDQYGSITKHVYTPSPSTIKPILNNKVLPLNTSGSLRDGQVRTVKEQPPQFSEKKTTEPITKKHHITSIQTTSPLIGKLHLNPGMPLSNIFSEVKGENFQDTVDHKIMTPTSEGIKLGLKGKWHVKKPGKVSTAEDIKRKVVNLSFMLRNKSYKANHYSNKKTLVEKEVLAGKITRYAAVNTPTFAQLDWQIEQDMQFAYCSDEGEPCVGNQHISHKHLATKEEAGENYDGEHNPLTAYIFRRFFLGDDDGVKKGNYSAPSKECLS